MALAEIQNQSGGEYANDAASPMTWEPLEHFVISSSHFLVTSAPRRLPHKRTVWHHGQGALGPAGPLCVCRVAWGRGVAAISLLSAQSRAKCLAPVTSCSPCDHTVRRPRGWRSPVTCPRGAPPRGPALVYGNTKDPFISWQVRAFYINKIMYSRFSLLK